MRSKLVWIILLLISSNAYSISVEDFVKSIKDKKYTRIDCVRTSGYSKNHASILPIKGRYARPNLYDYLYIQLIESPIEKKYEIWGESSSSSKFNDEYDAHLRVDNWVMSYKNLTITRETPNSIVFQSNKDIDGRIDMFDLDKLNGNLKMYIWEMKTTQTKPNDTFKFRQESAKEELISTETIQFKCK